MDIKAMMDLWLLSDDPVKVRHAKARIAIGFDQPVKPSNPVPPGALPVQSEVKPTVVARVGGCRSCGHSGVASAEKIRRIEEARARATERMKGKESAE